MTIAYLLVFFTGASIGSFAYAFALRYPRGDKWAADRSKCTHCHEKLRWYELIPLISYIIQGGRCRSCKKSIGVGNLLAEIVMGAVAIMLLSNNITATDIDLYSYIFWFTVATLFFIIAASDLKYFIIPDKVLIFSLIVLLVARLMLSDKILLGDYYLYLISGGALSLFFLILWLISKGRWIGFGDVKLAALIGLIFGYPGSFIIFYIAIVTGALVGMALLIRGSAGRKTPLPLGTFLASVSIIYIIFGPQIDSFFGSFLYPLLLQ